MKKILIPMIDVGAGHVTPARAIRDSIEECYPGKYSIEIVEISLASGAVKEHEFMRKYCEVYLNHRWVVDFSMILMEMLNPLSFSFLPIFMPNFLKKGMAYLAEKNPDLIISTHYFPSTIAAIAKKKKLVTCPVVSSLTDPFSPFLWWCESRADFLFAPTYEAERGFRSRGIKPSQIVRVPFPIGKKFYSPLPERETLFKRYNLNQNFSTLLVSYGGEGSGKGYEFISKTMKSKMPFNWLIVCGRNASIYEKMQKIADTSPYPFRVFQFVDNMHELMHMSDVVVGKAGTSTLFEALFLGKPLLVTDYTTYMAERKNLLFALRHHAGWWAPDYVSFLSVLETILTTDTLKQYKRNIESIPLIQQLKTNKNAIAHWVDSLLGKQ